MMIIVPVIEEFGYRHWYWIFPGTREELIADWKEREAPINYFNPSVGNFRGQLVPADNTFEFVYVVNTTSVKAHVFEEDNSFLQIGIGESSVFYSTGAYGRGYPLEFARSDLKYKRMWRVWNKD